jgi:hypothetical protein
LIGERHEYTKKVVKYTSLECRMKIKLQKSLIYRKYVTVVGEVIEKRREPRNTNFILIAKIK